MSSTTPSNPHPHSPPSSPTFQKRRRAEFTSPISKITTAIPTTDKQSDSSPPIKCNTPMPSHTHHHHSTLPLHHPHHAPQTQTQTQTPASPSSSLRQAIRRIQQSSLSDLEIQSEIHNLFVQVGQRAIQKPNPVEQGVFPGKGATPGCAHYERKCWIRAKCCAKYYPCRRCHDEAEEHEIDRHATEQVACVQCGLEGQNVAPECLGCGVSFAKYFCADCKFYDDADGKEAYHCAGCGICRVGKGLGIDNFHCDGCQTCVPIDAKDSHPCRERSLDANCPICTCYLRTSTEPAVFMRCGHTMHVECLSRHTQNGYTCPLCNKCLTDMTDWYKALDERISREVVQPEYMNRRSRVLCHDCGEKTVVNFHFVYHKCGNTDCGGYNTRVLEQFDVEGGDQLAVPPNAAVPVDSTMGQLEDGGAIVEGMG